MFFIASTLALICVQLISPVQSTGNICFLKPHITTATLETERISPNRFKLTIDVDLDYTKQFLINNIFVNFNFTTKSIEVQTDKLNISYVDQIPITRTSRDRKSNQYFTDVKSHYYLKASQFIRNYPKVDSLFFGNHCSFISIKDAFIFETLNSDGSNYNYINYKDSSRCIYRKTSNFEVDYKDCCITAASYNNTVAVEFFANFIVIKVHEGSLYGEIVGGRPKQSGFLLQTIEYSDFFSSACENASKTLQLTRTTTEDLLGPGSFQTFSKFDGMFIGFKPSIQRHMIFSVHAISEQELYTWRKSANGYNMNIAKAYSLPWVYGQPTYTLDALSISDESTPTGHAFYYNNDLSSSCRHYYLKNFKPNSGIPQAPAALCQPVVPDDITHWSSCRKIVAIYGFTYALFEYDSDLVTEKVQLQLFDQNLFDFPITAVHAEGDEFWFFTKTFTVHVMKASSNDCTKLNLVKKHTIHYRQLFDPEIKQLMLEERYHDGVQWTPSWDYVPSLDIEGPQVWTYVAGGLALTAVFLILLLIYILRRSERSRGASVFSLSRTSSIFHNSTPLSDKNQGTVASGLPLFSQHETLHRSSSSTSARKKGTSPGHRRKYLETPAGKQKKSKSGKKSPL